MRHYCEVIYIGIGFIKRKAAFSMKKLLFILIISLLGAAMLTACSPDPETALVGTWECRDDSEYEHDYLCLLTFYDSGRFTDRDGDEGDWRIFGNTLTLDYDEYISHTMSFEFRGNSRVIITFDGFTTMLHRR
jgi:hypothetical protein